MVALVAVLGLFDLIYFARFLSQPVRPGSLERMPQRLSREQILSYACFTAGIQNLALMVTLLGGDWVIRKWRMGSAGPFVIFVALGLLPFALMAIALFIAMLRVNDLT